jgi:hypothetical protein
MGMGAWKLLGSGFAFFLASVGVGSPVLLATLLVGGTSLYLGYSIYSGERLHVRRLEYLIVVYSVSATFYLIDILAASASATPTSELGLGMSGIVLYKCVVGRKAAKQIEEASFQKQEAPPRQSMRTESLQASPPESAADSHQEKTSSRDKQSPSDPSSRPQSERLGDDGDATKGIMRIPKLGTGEGKTLIVCVAILGLTVIVAVYLWGQKSRYTLVKEGSSGNGQVIKLDRQTGKSWRVTDFGEMPLWDDPNTDSADQAVDIPPSKIEIIEPQLSFTDPGYGGTRATFTGRIRNNSSEALGSLNLRVRIFKRLESGSNANPSGSSNEGDSLVFIPDETGRGFTPLKTHISDANRSNYSQEPVDGEKLRWPGSYEYRPINEYRSIPPGETESIEIVSKPTTMRPPEYWAWSFEIRAAHGN